MKTNVKIKRPFLVLGFIVFSVALAYGQDNILIYPKEVTKAAEKVKNVLQKSAAYVSVDFVKIDLEKIPNHEQFVLQFEERSILVRKERVIKRETNSYSFIGSNEKNDRILLSVFGDDIQGTIETSTGIFSVMTVGKGEYAVVKVDQSKLKEGCEHLESKSSGGLNLGLEDVNTTASPVLASAQPYSCKIRVLVLYTPNAKSSVSSIENVVFTAVDLTNMTFGTSGITYEIELAYAGLTNYTEVDYTTDRDRVRINGDGYMDEVHGLRDKYSADVVVLLIRDPSICGIASGIYVAQNAAFCVVSTIGDCATSYFSFGHEIGHLVGCRHDPYVDNNSTPFPYGHGYVSPTNEWRTVMAYGNACNGCQRVGHWSNPHINFNGRPTGTTTTNHNARVWNEQSNRVMAFRQPPNNITIINSDVANSTYGDAVAKQTITTSGTVNIKSGSIIKMRASNGVTLMPGFSVAAGAEFYAAVENIYNCP